MSDKKTDGTPADDASPSSAQALPAPVSADEAVVLGRRFKSYSADQRRRFFERILQMRYGPFDLVAGEAKKTWTEVAEALGVARSTLAEWKGSDEFKALERRYRQQLKDEARTDLASLQERALAHMAYLSENAGSEHVQFLATQALLEHANLAAEEEEKLQEAQGELVRFQTTLTKIKAKRELMRAAGVEAGSVREARVRPGGLLPEAVVQQNEVIKQLRAGEQDAEEEEAIDAEYEDLDDEGGA
jgi:hypothetical protein